MAVYPSESPPWPAQTSPPSTSNHRSKPRRNDSESVRRRRTPSRRQTADGSQISKFLLHLVLRLVATDAYLSSFPAKCQSNVFILTTFFSPHSFPAGAAMEQCEVFSGNQIISCFPTSNVIVPQHDYAPFVCASSLFSVDASCRSYTCM